MDCGWMFVFNWWISNTGNGLLYLQCKAIVWTNDINWNPRNKLHSQLGQNINKHIFQVYNKHTAERTHGYILGTERSGFRVGCKSFYISFSRVSGDPNTARASDPSSGGTALERPGSEWLTIHHDMASDMSHEGTIMGHVLSVGPGIRALVIIYKAHGKRRKSSWHCHGQTRASPSKQGCFSTLEGFQLGWG